MINSTDKNLLTYCVVAIRGMSVCDAKKKRKKNEKRGMKFKFELIKINKRKNI